MKCINVALSFLAICLSAQSQSRQLDFLPQSQSVKMDWEQYRIIPTGLMNPRIWDVMNLNLMGSYDCSGTRLTDQSSATSGGSGAFASNWIHSMLFDDTFMEDDYVDDDAYKTTTTTYAPDNAFDSPPSESIWGGRAGAGGPTDFSIGYEFGTSVIVRCIQIKQGNVYGDNGSTKIVLQGSDDGLTWSNINGMDPTGVEVSANGGVSTVYIYPTESPSSSPSTAPSVSIFPSAMPSTAPSASPTESPSASPSTAPSASPSESPSASPSTAPSASIIPSAMPSTAPTQKGMKKMGKSASGGMSMKSKSDKLDKKMGKAGNGGMSKKSKSDKKMGKAGKKMGKKKRLRVRN